MPHLCAGRSRTPLRPLPDCRNRPHGPHACGPPPIRLRPRGLAI